MHYVISGGVGDFLQCLPFLLVNSKSVHKYVVISHFREAASFFDFFGIIIDIYKYYDNNIELGVAMDNCSKMGNVEFCPRTQYFDNNPFTHIPKLFNNDLKVVGLHLSGSKYSQTGNKENGLSGKNIPHVLLDILFNFKCNLILFGAPNELELMPWKEHQFLRKFTSHKIIDCLSAASTCDVFIGCDSAFKTLSSMLRIPTFVWLPNYEDIFRDRIFIDPYVRDCYMDTTRFSSLDSSTFDSAIKDTIIFFEKNEIYCCEDF